MYIYDTIYCMNKKPKLSRRAVLSAWQNELSTTHGDPDLGYSEEVNTRILGQAQETDVTSDRREPLPDPYSIDGLRRRRQIAVARAVLEATSSRGSNVQLMLFNPDCPPSGDKVWSSD